MPPIWSSNNAVCWDFCLPKRSVSTKRSNQMPRKHNEILISTIKLLHATKGGTYRRGSSGRWWEMDVWCQLAVTHSVLGGISGQQKAKTRNHKWTTLVTLRRRRGENNLQIKRTNAPKKDWNASASRGNYGIVVREQKNKNPYPNNR